MEKPKVKIEIHEYLNGELIKHEIGEKILENLLLDDSFFNGDLENKGIKNMNLMYLEVTETQDVCDEYNKILEFIKKYIEKYISEKGISADDVSLEFINYGKTELVYGLTDKNGETITLLVKQPAVKHGEVLTEMNNLIELKKRDDSIVAPIDYFSIGDMELYVTPYIKQARCVASYGKWGMYVPEPFYRFESFSMIQESIVNTCMIAKLVSFYDFERNEGISSCKIGGGDFMLPKGWESTKPTIENTLNSLYFIAARNKVNCTFEEYLDIIREEFSKTTIDLEQDKLIINLRGRVAMNIEDIENGIVLGKKIINESKGFQYLKKY